MEQEQEKKNGGLKEVWANSAEGAVWLRSDDVVWATRMQSLAASKERALALIGRVCGRTEQKEKKEKEMGALGFEDNIGEAAATESSGQEKPDETIAATIEVPGEGSGLGCWADITEEEQGLAERFFIGDADQQDEEVVAGDGKEEALAEAAAGADLVSGGGAAVEDGLVLPWKDLVLVSGGGAVDGDGPGKGKQKKKKRKKQKKFSIADNGNPEVDHDGKFDQEKAAKIEQAENNCRNIMAELAESAKEAGLSSGEVQAHFDTLCWCGLCHDEWLRAGWRCPDAVTWGDFVGEVLVSGGGAAVEEDGKGKQKKEKEKKGKKAGGWPSGWGAPPPGGWGAPPPGGWGSPPPGGWEAPWQPPL